MLRTKVRHQQQRLCGQTSREKGLTSQAVMNMISPLLYLAVNPGEVFAYPVVTEWQNIKLMAWNYRELEL
jgi:hypothetical protein